MYMHSFTIQNPKTYISYISAISIKTLLFNSTSNVNKVFVAAEVIGVFNVVSYMLSV